MILRKTPGCAALHALVPVWLASVALASCSSTPALVPDAFVDAQIGPAHGASTGLCKVAGLTEVLQIGTLLPRAPTTIKAGASQPTGKVNVTCSVAGGQVSLNIELTGTQGGALVIAGTVNGSGGSNISADLNVPAHDGDFSQSDCTIAFTYGGATVPTMPPFAGGRIWGHLSCPNMVNMSGSVVSTNGGAAQAKETCDAEVDFQFQNCSQ